MSDEIKIETGAYSLHTRYSQQPSYAIFYIYCWWTAWQSKNNRPTGSGYDKARQTKTWSWSFPCPADHITASGIKTDDEAARVITLNNRKNAAPGVADYYWRTQTRQRKTQTRTTIAFFFQLNRNGTRVLQKFVSVLLCDNSGSSFPPATWCNTTSSLSVDPDVSIDQLMLTYSSLHMSHRIAPFDARFPNTNQSKHCWQSYSDYYKCINARGEEFTGCKQFFKTFKSICPNEWVRFIFLLQLSDNTLTLPLGNSFRLLSSGSRAGQRTRIESLVLTASLYFVRLFLRIGCQVGWAARGGNSPLQGYRLKFLIDPAPLQQQMLQLVRHFFPSHFGPSKQPTTNQRTPPYSKIQNNNNKNTKTQSILHGAFH